MPSWASAVAAAFSAFVALMTWKNNSKQRNFVETNSEEERRRSDLELARSLHSELTVGIADARDQLGSAVRSSESAFDQSDPELRHAYFRMLWCFERLWAGWQIMGDDGRVFLKGLAVWHVDQWVRDLPSQRGRLRISDDRDSRKGLDSLAAAFELAPPEWVSSSGS